MILCKIKGCIGKYDAKGLCRDHYNKNYYKENTDKCKNNSARWTKNNPEKRFIIMKKHFKKYGKKFDMTSMEYSFAIQAWARMIKKLDNNMCKNCDSTNNLNAHHLRPKNSFPELSLDLDNGITLCEKCHSKTHEFEIYKNLY